MTTKIINKVVFTPIQIKELGEDNVARIIRENNNYWIEDDQNGERHIIEKVEVRLTDDEILKSAEYAGAVFFLTGGKRVFLFDREVQTLLNVGAPVGDPLNFAIMIAWYKGWDKENMKTF